MATTSDTPLISPDALLRLLRGTNTERPMLIDTRFDLANPKWGHNEYLKSTLKGAVHFDLDRHLSSPHIAGKTGRHPLPDMASWSNLLANVGLLDADGKPRQRHIIIFDQGPGAFAARAWWLLKSTGFQHVQVLDGGFQYILTMCSSLDLAAGHAVTDKDHPFPASLQISPTAYCQIADVKSAMESTDQCILDARSYERYQGQVEPIDPVAGHIPGSINRDFNTNLDSTDKAGVRFKSAKRLKDEYQALLGSNTKKPAICYCGSGVTACHNVLAMALAGLPEPILYPGSWSEWIIDPSNPVETNIS